MLTFEQKLKIVTARMRAQADLLRFVRLGQKAMPGGEFFALIDECDASERRLDEMAKPLLKKLAETEGMAGRAIEGRMAKLDAAQDYINRMQAAGDKLAAGNKTNGGPSVGGSSSKPSETLTVSSTDIAKLPPAANIPASNGAGGAPALTPFVRSNPL